MITYDFYVNTYLGSSIPEGEWPLFAARAQAKLNHYKRIYTVTAPEENSEAMAVCAMADTLWLILSRHRTALAVLWQAHLLVVYLSVMLLETG